MNDVNWREWLRRVNDHIDCRGLPAAALAAVRIYNSIEAKYSHVARYETHADAAGWPLRDSPGAA